MPVLFTMNSRLTQPAVWSSKPRHAIPRWYLYRFKSDSVSTHAVQGQAFIRKKILALVWRGGLRTKATSSKFQISECQARPQVSELRNHSTIVLGMLTLATCPSQTGRSQPLGTPCSSLHPPFGKTEWRIRNKTTVSN